ncbi:adsorption protein [Vibrio vulnificus]|nr:adsorption protein [Vibrio vulnificus]MCU8413317.1 adsorption protein [Vibrio vulnificus]MCU8413318.1 adsorption protein [Vibrio vulnificus]MCU8413339.1 adsorption protein [Vibrio vulnificus]MCU8413352.1 adsorption protein [Vibrio vulnificus]
MKSLIKALLIFALFFGVSRTVYSQEFVTISYFSNAAFGCTLDQLGYFPGKIVDKSSFNELVGLTCGSGTVSNVSIATSSATVYFGGVNRLGIVGFSSFNGCPDGQQVNIETGKCEASRCSSVKDETGKIGWNSAWWGKTSPSSYVCSPKGDGCVALVGESYCIDIDPDALASDPGLYDCDAYYIVQEPECNIPDGASFCTDETCAEFMPEPEGPTKPNPDPDPDPEPEPDPEHKPTDPTDPIPDPSPLPDESEQNPIPNPVDPEPEVPDPTPDPDGNSDVVSAVTNMNRDINKALYDLNIDINKSNASIESELNRLNKNTRQNTQAIKDLHQANLDIAQNTKKLIQQANADITTSVNKNTNAINSLKGEVSGLGDSLTSIDGTLTGMAEDLDSIVNTDTSGAGTGGTCIATDSCTGFYESGYPNGVGGVFSDHFSSISSKVTDTLSGMFELDLSAASRPKFGIPVPFYGWFYFTDYINLDWVFAFVRVCMMVTTAFLCRKLLFGG